MAALATRKIRARRREAAREQPGRSSGGDPAPLARSRTPLNCCAFPDGVRSQIIGRLVRNRFNKPIAMALRDSLNNLMIKPRRRCQVQRDKLKEALSDPAGIYAWYTRVRNAVRTDAAAVRQR